MFFSFQCPAIMNEFRNVRQQDLCPFLNILSVLCQTIDHEETVEDHYAEGGES